MQILQETVPTPTANAPSASGASVAPDGSTARPRDLVLRIEGLTKRFDRVMAVDGLSLDVRRGEVVGLLGPNGAGKSTTVGIILGLIAPDAGRIDIIGEDVARTHVERREIGAVVEQPAFYPYLSGRDNLQAIALAAGGVPGERISDLLRLLGLEDRADSKYKTYSLGMKQRLGIASTLLTDPSLVILDEPANGLDPSGQREVRELIPHLAAQGHGVLLASHLLHEVQQVCSRVVIIRSGKLVAAGTVADLLHRESVLQIDIAEPQRAADVLRSLAFVRQLTVAGNELTVAAPIESGPEISRVLAEHGLYAAAIVPRTNSLEEIFFELTEPDGGSDKERPQ